MARVKQIIGLTAIVLFAATLAGIWVLTEQNAVETSLLSESTARVVEGQATGVQAVDATGEAQTEYGMTGGRRFDCLECPVWPTCFHSHVGGHKRPSRCPYRRVFLRRIVRLRGRGLLFQASVERMLPLRARIALLRRLLRWRSGA